jgi:hypothetical protein
MAAFGGADQGGHGLSGEGLVLEEGAGHGIERGAVPLEGAAGPVGLFDEDAFGLLVDARAASAARPPRRTASASSRSGRWFKKRWRLGAARWRREPLPSAGSSGDGSRSRSPA